MTPATPTGGLTTPKDAGTATAAADVLAYLQQVAPLTLWAVVRFDDGAGVLDATAGPDGAVSGDPPVAGFGVGSRFPWSALICSRMAEGNGPRVAPDVRRVPSYASAPIARRLPVGAYIGAPIRFPDGVLAGSICGLDPSPQPEQLAATLPMVELVADLLGHLRGAEREAARQRDRAERAERAERRADGPLVVDLTEPVRIG